MGDRYIRNIFATKGGERVKDKKLYRCPTCKHTLHSIGKYGRKWRCINPNCTKIFVENPNPADGKGPTDCR